MEKVLRLQEELRMAIEAEGYSLVMAYTAKGEMIGTCVTGDALINTALAALLQAIVLRPTLAKFDEAVAAKSAKG